MKNRCEHNWLGIPGSTSSWCKDCGTLRAIVFPPKSTFYYRYYKPQKVHEVKYWYCHRKYDAGHKCGMCGRKGR